MGRGGGTVIQTKLGFLRCQLGPLIPRRLNSVGLSCKVHSGHRIDRCREEGTVDCVLIYATTDSQ
jgi:hypothetical protein